MAPSLHPLNPRRWLRFGIRAVLVLMVLVAIPLAWKVNRVRTQRLAVAEMLRGGSSCIYDYEEEWPFALPARPEPPEPLWLRNFLGDDFFSDVVSASYDETLSPNVPALLPSLPEVNKLVVLRGTDASLGSIASLSELHNLRLIGDFSGQGVARLGSLTKLKILALSTNTLDDAQLESLAALKTLDALEISSDQLTDEGLERLLQRLPNVRLVEVSSNRITDRSLDYLGRRDGMARISAYGDLLTDDGCNRLIQAMPSMCTLDLPTNPGVTVWGTKPAPALQILEVTEP